MTIGNVCGSSVSRETLNRLRLKYRLYVNYFISTSKAECIYMSQIIENNYCIPRCAAQLVPRGCRCGDCGHSLTVPPRPLPRRGGTDRSGLGRTSQSPTPPLCCPASQQTNTRNKMQQFAIGPFSILHLIILEKPSIGQFKTFAVLLEKLIQAQTSPLPSMFTSIITGVLSSLVKSDPGKIRYDGLLCRAAAGQQTGENI